MSHEEPAAIHVLSLGSNVVELLLPQRWPLLMVDRIERFNDGARPTLEASRFLSASDVMFQGHFPGLHLWPGCLTIEGLGQSGAALMAILAIRDRMAAASGDAEAGFEALRNLDRGFRLHPGYRADHAASFREIMQDEPATVSVGAAIDVRLRRPVFAGQRLDYLVRLAYLVGDSMKFEVEASVDGVAVADGTMTGTRLPRAAMPARYG